MELDLLSKQELLKIVKPDIIQYQSLITFQIQK